MTKDQGIRFSLFKQELSALCRKYQIGIAGCGCCGSPWIYCNNENGSVEEEEDNINVTVDGEIKSSSSCHYTFE